MDLAPEAPTRLYEAGAREYAPGLGAFTALDPVIGHARDPRSMHRYLYAHANPASLVDPDGHAALPACDTDRYDFCHPVSIPTGSDPNGNATPPVSRPYAGGGDEPGLRWIRQVNRELAARRGVPEVPLPAEVVAAATLKIAQKASEDHAQLLYARALAHRLKVADDIAALRGQRVSGPFWARLSGRVQREVRAVRLGIGSTIDWTKDLAKVKGIRLAAKALIPVGIAVDFYIGAAEQWNRDEYGVVTGQHIEFREVRAAFVGAATAVGGAAGGVAGGLGATFACGPWCGVGGAVAGSVFLGNGFGWLAGDVVLAAIDSPPTVRWPWEP